MEMVIQYVTSANVSHKEISHHIQQGYVCLIGIHQSDSPKHITSLTHKMLSLRIIPDKHHKLNLSIQDISGQLLLIPQFTLLADTTKGQRPSYANAASPHKAQRLFNQCVGLAKEYVDVVKTGFFGKHMQLTLTNEGPITVMISN